MYAIKITGFKKTYLMEEMIKIFLNPNEYRIIEEENQLEPGEELIVFNDDSSQDKDKIKREIFDKLSTVTGNVPAWGILTGIRPVKLCGELTEKLGDTEKVKKHLMEYYYVSEKKTDMIIKMYQEQKRLIGFAKEKEWGIYIGIPFCPTRCLYCSFTSNQEEYAEILKYLEALKKEIRETATMMRAEGVVPETIYIGGGTPTTLEAPELEDLLNTVRESFDMEKVKEFTVEAGRPDTITEEKLRILKEAGALRISINPQSMKPETMKLIGRHHTPDDILKAFEIAAGMGFECINADLIAGLPGESEEDFLRSLKIIESLHPENITVHSLAVKRTSVLKEIDPDYQYKSWERTVSAIQKSGKFLQEKGYRPYYLYRQKHMAGAAENTGYAKPGKEGIYNMRIMDEHQTILALGAGGISKAYNYATRKLIRVPNVTNYREYIDRIDEMINRKKERIFDKIKS